MSVLPQVSKEKDPVQPGAQETDELSESQLDEVSGGLNPQPEPPGRRIEH